MVELPATLSGQDLDGAVRHLAGDLLPVGLDQLVVDYRRVGHAPAEAGGQQRVLMAAARVDGIDRLMRALHGAGLRAQRIQLSGLALLSALDHPPVGDDAILYVQAGALTNVVITEHGEPLLVRAASAGSEAIAAGLAERAGITHAAARERVAAVGVGRPDGAGPTPDDDVDAAAAVQVREGLRRVVAEIQSSRGFYSARPDARPIGAVVLTGAMTSWPGVLDALTRELHLPVLPAGRDAWPDLDGVTVAPERLDIAIGLARAGEDERPDMRPVRAARLRQAGGAPSSARVAQVACGMAAVVAAAVVYLVVVTNQVNTGREHLGQLASQLHQSEQRAAALKPYADFVTATTTRRDAVAAVAKTRFKWDRTLTELAKVAPDGVWLTSVTGTLAPGVQPVAAPAAGAAAPVSPTIALSGCATHERGVPAYIDRLQLLTGVTEVGFTRSERLDKKKGGPSATAAIAGSGSDCRGNDTKAAQFDLTTTFKGAPVLPAAAAQTVATTNAAALAAVATPPTAAAPPTQTPAATTGGSR
jgi:Tfp pilus assembly protein PilN